MCRAVAETGERLGWWQLAMHIASEKNASLKTSSSPLAEASCQRLGGHEGSNCSEKPTVPSAWSKMVGAARPVKI